MTNFLRKLYLRSLIYGVSELFTSLKRGHDGRKHIIFIKMYAFLVKICLCVIFIISILEKFDYFISIQDTKIVTRDLFSNFRVEIWRFFTRKKNHLHWVSCITVHDTLTADNNLSLRLEFVSQSNKFLIIMS